MTSPKHALIKLYVQAKLREQTTGDQLCRAFQLLNSENQIFGTTPSELTELLDALMRDKFGTPLMDWVEWWMYDCGHGTAHTSFTVEGRDYDVTDLTFEQFLELVDESN